MGRRGDQKNITKIKKYTKSVKKRVSGENLLILMCELSCFEYKNAKISKSKFF